MFTINQIKEAHAKVKSGADFPKYVQDIIALGVKSYSTYVTDGHTEYKGADDFSANNDPKYGDLAIADKSDNEKFKHYLKAHQQGKSDYLTFCNQSAETGVEKWIVDTNEMTCIYYDKSGNAMLVETIPSV